MPPNFKSRALFMFSKYLMNFALTKGELTRANVEPFKVELSDVNPCFERPMRYNRVLTKTINDET